MPTTEVCQNCGSAIGNLEIPHVWHSKVVCATCAERLQAGSALHYETPVAAAPPVPAQPVVVVKESSGCFRAFSIGVGIAVGLVLILVAGGSWLILKTAGGQSGASNQSPKMLAAPVTPQAIGDVQIEYDRFKNQTTVKVGDGSKSWRPEPLNGTLSESGEDDVYIEAWCLIDGTQVVKEPPFIVIDISGPDAGDGSVGQPIPFIIDGVRREIPLLGSPSRDFVGLEVPINLFKQMAEATDVEFRDGGAEFRLTPSQQQAFSELLKQLGVQ